MNHTTRAALFALTLSILSGCATQDSASAARTAAGAATAAESTIAEALMRDLSPLGGQPRFLGVSGRLRNRDDELAAALVHAAEQASRYSAIAARYRFVAQRSGRTVGFVDDLDVGWDASLADRLVETMDVVAVEQDGDGTYVVATTAAVPPPPPVTVDAPRRGEPSWVASPPAIPGYIVAVGVSRRSLRFRDSVDTADEQALSAVVQQASATVRLVQDERTRNNAGTAETVTTSQEAEAELRQFYVVARHASEDRQYYYSLVVAREVE